MRHAMGRDAELVMARGMVMGQKNETESWKRHFENERRIVNEQRMALQAAETRVEELEAENEGLKEQIGARSLIQTPLVNAEKAMAVLLKMHADLADDLGYKEAPLEIERARQAALAVLEAARRDGAMVYGECLEAIEQLKLLAPEACAKLGLLG
jgi:hypothetical protein